MEKIYKDQENTGIREICKLLSKIFSLSGSTDGIIDRIDKERKEMKMEEKRERSLSRNQSKFIKRKNLPDIRLR